MIFLFFGDFMKKIICLLLTFFSIFLIYRHFDNHKINYVSLGDGLIKGMNSSNIAYYGYNDFVKEYLSRNNKISTFNNYFYNKTILEITEDIKNNRTIWINDKEFFLKKVLRESDILVISVGMEELFENYQKYDMEQNYIYFNKMYVDIENLVKEVKKYTKGMILFLGYYNPTNFYDSKTDEFFCDIDIKLNRLMMVNDISYIDLYEKVKGNRYKDNIDTPFLNVRGYEKIAETIEYYLE